MDFKTVSLSPVDYIQFGATNKHCLKIIPQDPENKKAVGMQKCKDSLWWSFPFTENVMDWGSCRWG